MLFRIFVVLLVSLFPVQVVYSGDKVVTLSKSESSLEAAVIAVNASLIEHYTVIHEVVKAALKKGLVMGLNREVLSNIVDRKKNLQELLEEVKRTEDKVFKFGGKYSKCGQMVTARGVFRQMSAAMDLCSDPFDDFLDEYLDEMIWFSAKYHSAAQLAYLEISQCVPQAGGDVDEGKHCLHVEGSKIRQVFATLEGELVTLQDASIKKAESVLAGARLCTHKKLRMAQDILRRLVDRLTRCVHEDQNGKGLTMEDFQEEVDKTTALLTELYEEIDQEVTVAIENDMISSSLVEIEGMISGAEEIVTRMSSGTFEIIAEVEANGSYPQCVQGAGEKAQGILDEAMEILPGCGSVLQELDVEYQGELGDILRDLQEQRDAAEESVRTCEPEDGETATEEEIAQGIACVVTAREGAKEVFLSLQERFLTTVNDTEVSLQRSNEEARRCVDTASHVAGDRTGYLRYEIEQCMANTDASTTPAVTLGETGESLVRISEPLQRRLSQLNDETNSASNNQVITDLIVIVADKVLNADDTFAELGARIILKVDDADERNFSSCTVGLVDEAVSALKYSMLMTRHCLDPLNKLAETYQEQIATFLEEYVNAKEIIYERLADCLLASTSLQTALEIEQTAECLQIETTAGNHIVSLLQQSLATLVHHTNHQASLVSSQAEVCITDEEAETVSDQEELMREIDNCVQVFSELLSLEQT